MCAQYEQRSDGSRRPRILVVEDDKGIRELACLALETEGYGCVAVADGAEALERLRAEPFDLVLLDLMMPVVDGWDFRRAQLADPAVRSVPVLVMTAVHNPGPSVDDLKPDGLLSKPFDVDELLSAVARLTGSAD